MVKNHNFGKKSEFWPTIGIFVKKIGIMVKNGNFTQKS